MYSFAIAGVYHCSKGSAAHLTHSSALLHIDLPYRTQSMVRTIILYTISTGLLTRFVAEHVRSDILTLYYIAYSPLLLS